MTPAIAGEGKSSSLQSHIGSSVYRQSFLHDHLYGLHLPGPGLHLHHHRDRAEADGGEPQEDAGAPGSDTGTSQTG